MEEKAANAAETPRGFGSANKRLEKVEKDLAAQTERVNKLVNAIATSKKVAGI